MLTEIREGRGWDGPWCPHIKLKLDHLGKEVLESRLPGILELSRTFAHVDPVKEPIPVIPTCHYMMGGIPTNVDGQAISIDENVNEKPITGLFACGEIACVSVHGANRLGGNSLLDLVVFGRATGLHLGEKLDEIEGIREASGDDVDAALARFNRWESSEVGKGECPVQIKKDMQQCMQLNFSVFREGDAMAEGLKELAEKLGTPGYLTDTPDDIDPEWFAQKVRVGVTAGASAPEELVNQIIDKIQSIIGSREIEEIQGREENMFFEVPRELQVRQID